MKALMTQSSGGTSPYVAVSRAEAMLAWRCVQQCKYLRVQSSCCMAAIATSRAKVSRVQALQNPSSCRNIAAVIRLAALLPPNLLSGHPKLGEKQAVPGRSITLKLFLHKSRDSAGNLNLGPRGLRAISVKRKSRSSGGSDSDLFEEWLKANPLPDVGHLEGNQRGNGSPAVDAGEFGPYHNSGYKKSGTGNEKLTGKECGDFEMLPDSNGMQDRGEKGAVLGKLESLKDNVSDISDGPTNVSGLRFGDLGFQHRREFSWQETGDVLYECLCECDELAWDNEQKRFLEVNSSRGGWRIEFIPPLIQPPLSSCCTPKEYLQSLHQREECQGKNQLLALLSSNAAALAIFNDGKLLVHKVITGYTVRAKQGKSQLKYMREGGPGRMTAGGAIRAREVDRFFTRVCEKLNEWSNEIEDCEVLFLSGTARVWNEVYAADNLEILIPRNDSRWCKIPYNVHEPRFREVQRVFYKLSHGAVGYTCDREENPQR